MRRLARFRTQFPAVDIQVHIQRPDPLFARLLAHSLDVVCYVKVRTPPELSVESVGHEELVIVASPNHRLARRRRISARELSEEPLVVTGVTVFRELVEEKLRRRCHAPCRGRS
jgi:DNA-binding transcriptional LysR family regulator